MTEKIGSGFGSALNTALSGLQRELQSISNNAQKVSDFSNQLESGEDITGPLVELKRDAIDVKAITKVIGVVSELEDEVLDIIA